jgi:hypothetical protein
MVTLIKIVEGMFRRAGGGPRPKLKQRLEEVWRHDEDAGTIPERETQGLSQKEFAALIKNRDVSVSNSNSGGSLGLK